VCLLVSRVECVVVDVDKLVYINFVKEAFESEGPGDP